MSIELVGILALLGVVGYFLFLRRPRRSQAVPPSEVVAPIEPPELSLDEQEVERARNALQAGADARHAAFGEHKASLAEAETKIRDAEKFVKESGLDVALPWLWDHMNCWPSWNEKPDQWTPPLALDQISGVSHEEVQWTWQGHSFAMVFKKWPPHGVGQGYQDYGTITVEAGSSAVAAVTATRDLSKEYDRWRFAGVEALTVGPWMTDLIRFYQQLRLADEARGYSRSADHITAKAAKIDLR